MQKLQLARAYNLAPKTSLHYLEQIEELNTTNLKRISIFTPLELHTIYKYWGEPAPFINRKELARQYGISTTTLYTWLDLHNIKFKYTLISPLEQQILKKIFG